MLPRVRPRWQRVHCSPPPALPPHAPIEPPPGSSRTRAALSHVLHLARATSFLDKGEIMKIMTSLGTETFRAPDEAFVDRLIKEADIDGDGRINYDEFARVLHRA